LTIELRQTIRVQYMFDCFYTYNTTISIIFSMWTIIDIFIFPGPTSDKLRQLIFHSL